MANAVDMHGIQEKGDLGTTSAAELLRSIEASRSTVRIWLETEIGVGQIAFHEGRVVVAEVGPLRKRTALLRILGMTEGLYSIEHADAPPGPSIVPNVESAIQILADRQDEWRTLCASTPPMSSVLRLTAAGRSAKRESTGTERIVYPLVDGRRSLMDILEESTLDPIDVLRAIVYGMEAGYFEDLDNSASLLPLPIEEVSGEIVKIPSPPIVPRFQTSNRGGSRPAPEWGGMRKGTLVGLGVDFASFAPPPRQDAAIKSVETSPIIDVGADPGASSTNKTAAIEIIHQQIGVQPKDSGSPPPISEPADSLLVAEKPAAESNSSEANARIRHVGRYEVIYRIGRGGMGSVYLARLTAKGGFRRLFALKLLRSYLACDSAAADAFLAEARIAGQLHHPNVVGVVDAGVHQGQPYLVMDYVEGCSLKQLMSAHPDARPPRLIVPIILSALDGLGAVHNLRADDGTELNVVHCDVSPENLLVGADGMCRLTDFGVARRAQLDGARDIHGKPGYVAPEQVTGGAIDRRVDIFALGVVLWSALTGERLFHGATVEETLQRVRNQDIPAPSTVGLRPSHVFDDICMKALERNLDRRYASAEQMQVDLRDVAMREGLIGLNSEVASWVRRTVGQQLSQRRLLVLEASRPRDFVTSSREKPDDKEAAVKKATGERAISSAPPPSGRRLPGLGDDPESRTIPLQAIAQPGKGRQFALVFSAILAAAMVLVAILWPSVLARLFKMESQTASDNMASSGISVRVPASAPKAASRGAKAPTVTPVPNPSEVPSGSQKHEISSPRIQEH